MYPGFGFLYGCQFKMSLRIRTLVHIFRVCTFFSLARTLFSVHIGRGMTATEKKYRQKRRKTERQTLLCAVSSLILLPKNSFSSSETKLTHPGSLIQLLFFCTRDVTHKNILHHLCRVCCTWHKKVERSCFMKTVACSSGTHETQFSLNVINIFPIMNLGKVHVAWNSSRLIVRGDTGLRESYAGYSFRKWTSGKIRERH